MKLLVIGHNKSGTRFLHKLFKESGTPSAHWDQGRIAKAVYNNSRMCLDPFKGYEKYKVLSDIECTFTSKSIPNDYGILYQPYKEFAQLALKTEVSGLIFNFREVDAWVSSRLRHGNGYYALLYGWNLMLGDPSANVTVETIVSYWEKEHAQLSQEVANFERLCKTPVYRFNLDDQDYTSFNKFLAKLEINPVNQSSEKIGFNSTPTADLNDLNLKLEKLKVKFHSFYDQITRL